MATLLHGLYDFSIMTVAGDMKFVAPIVIILILAFYVFNRFKKLKTLKGVTVLNIKKIK